MFNINKDSPLVRGSARMAAMTASDAMFRPLVKHPPPVGQIPGADLSYPVHGEVPFTSYH
jgi:hypothetical protein